MKNELWKTIENAPNYEVSNLGNVRNRITGYILKGRITKRGYYQVCIKINGKFINQYIHRLVAQAWLSNDNNYTNVNHKDGDKSNNTVENLEWVTASENIIHAHQTGLISKTSNRKVGAFDIDGNLLFEYNSIQEAANVHSKAKSRNSIVACLSGRQHTAHGLFWKYLD